MEAERLSLRPNRKRKIDDCVFIVALSIGAIATGGMFRMVANGVLAFGIFLRLMAKYAISPMVVRRDFRTDKTASAERKILLEENGLGIVSKQGAGFIEWDSAHKWKQNTRFLIVYISQYKYTILPKYQLEPNIDFEKIERSLKLHCGAEA